VKEQKEKKYKRKRRTEGKNREETEKPLKKNRIHEIVRKD